MSFTLFKPQVLPSKRHGIVLCDTPSLWRRCTSNNKTNNLFLNINGYNFGNTASTKVPVNGKIHRKRLVRVLCSSKKVDDEVLSVVDSDVCNPNVELEAPSVVSALDNNESNLPLWTVPWDGWVTGLVTTKFLVLAFFLGILGVPLVAEVFGMSADQLTPQAKSVIVIVLQSLEAVAVWRLVQGSLKEYSPLPEPWFSYRWSEKRCYLIAGAGLGLALASVGVASMANQFILGNTGEASAAAPVRGLLQDGALTAALLSTTSVLITPSLEEYFWRGFFLPSLTRSMSTPTAIAISGFIFALAHCSPQDLVPLTALGCTLGVVAVASKGNLASSTLVHSVWNLVILISIGNTSG